MKRRRPPPDLPEGRRISSEWNYFSLFTSLFSLSLPPSGGVGEGPKKGQSLFRETARIRFLELEWITHLVRLRQKGKRQHKFHNQRSYQDR